MTFSRGGFLHLTTDNVSGCPEKLYAPMLSGRNSIFGIHDLKSEIDGANGYADMVRNLLRRIAKGHPIKQDLFVMGESGNRGVHFDVNDTTCNEYDAFEILKPWAL